uniref:NOP protein chaperone 1 n=1 Tax=Kryptolebias marmoratus TaxID=37003 RepID=A0A3Q3ACP5_KRYMA
MYHTCQEKHGRAFAKMDLKTQKTTSQTLLSCGNGGVSEKLLLKPKAAGAFQTERVPRSSVLERLQDFLPQMAEANEKLRRQIDEAPAGHFDIENVKEAEKVIEMVSGRARITTHTLSFKVKSEAQKQLSAYLLRAETIQSTVRK